MNDLADCLAEYRSRLIEKGVPSDVADQMVMDAGRVAHQTHQALNRGA